jgi:hypothetical protein
MTTQDLTRMNHDKNDDADLFRGLLIISASKSRSLVFNNRTEGCRVEGSVSAGGANPRHRRDRFHPRQVLP